MLILVRFIVDDHYQHDLRVLKDKDSGVVRLQASVRAGELRKWAWSSLLSIKSH